MKAQKRMILIAVCLAVVSQIVPFFSFAAEMKRNSQEHVWSEDVNQDTLVSYAVEEGNLYFGQYNDEESEEIHLLGADLTVTQAEIPAYVQGLCVTSISSKTFADCSGLLKVSIPKTVTSIAETAFYDCAALQEIIVEEGNTYLFTSDGALFQYSPFVGIVLLRYPAGSTLKTFEIPENTKMICAYAFRDAKNLESVHIPESVTNIEIGAFQNCDKLTDLFYAGPSSQWSQVRINYSIGLTDTVKIHCDRYADILESFAERIQNSDTLQKLSILIQEYPVVSHLLLRLGLYLLAIALVLFFMRRSLRERKRYMHYQRRWSQELGYSESTMLYYQMPMKKVGNLKLSTRVLRVAVIGLVSVDIMSAAIMQSDWGKMLTTGWIVLLPLLIAVTVLLTGLLIVWIVGRIRIRLKGKHSSAATSPIRVCTVRKGEDE